MLAEWQSNLVIFLRTVSEILTAGIAITAFSLLLYSLTFNLKDRVARTFALIMLWLVVIYSTEALGTTSNVDWQNELWLRLEWVGIIMLPGTYLHFSDALLATTGQPSRWRRRWAVRCVYAFSLLLLVALTFNQFVGPIVMTDDPAPHLRPTLVTNLFVIFYAGVIGMAWYNMARAYQRTRTATSRRRVAYLIVGSIAPALGSFPYMLFGSEFAARHTLIFWTLSGMNNLVMGLLIIVMAYAVTFFGVPWPDRIVQKRLMKWVLRGPAAASLTLAMTTLIRRLGELFGTSYSAFVPIIMVGSIVMFEYMITLFSPLWERWWFRGNDRADLALLSSLEERLVTENDLRQFLEMISAAVCDRLQAPGAYIAALENSQLEIVVSTGKNQIPDSDQSEGVLQLASRPGQRTEMFQWGADLIIPLFDGEDEHAPLLLGIFGVTGAGGQALDKEQAQAVGRLSERAALALDDRRMQRSVFHSLQSLTPQMEFIQSIRAAGSYDESQLLLDELPEPPSDLLLWVKEALTHYWGGPKLTQSPMMKLKIVQEAILAHDGNQANALRSILREAIERVRPDGDRRFTGEWILYNILELKFLEGKKVREVALRLSMSEADLYRKQRIAIEEVARVILEMEFEAQQQVGS
ncbi:MAG: hypothetical protein GYA17_16875 [Chloroflexi bacterium]|nr:hypothetical protein [Anaerolineaceae bacterium]NMB90033.1 hypothetical protein [Chloroflexota bacterium]